MKTIAGLVAGILLNGAAVAQGPLPTPSAAAPTSAASPMTTPATVPGQGAPMTGADVEAWLDGFMPFALARGDIAGGVVVVVKDGAVLVQKGYGFADIARRKPVSATSTLFRPGSTSKLFTWTAVMQLVERGRLDLDRDVNAYLDFKIPPFDGKPVTLRQIMTHTAGFQETARHLIGDDPKGVMPLGDFVKRSLPPRIFAPGVTPAYSNYATALAGYIVARVSGQSFDDYVDANLFRPLGMTSSSFRQPLPPRLAASMSQGYDRASGTAQKYEVVIPAPAGSLASTGSDMAKFMLAHLAGGRGLLRPETTRLMHDTSLTVLPPLNRMALGFYEQRANDQRTIGHGGDTMFFHSDMWLIPAQNVGVFVSVNSGGAPGAPGALRTALFDQFADRYYPATRSSARVDATTARQHAAMMAGSYTNSRGSPTNFLKILDLVGQAKLGIDADGGLVAASVTGLSDQPRKWVEIAPFVWRDIDSGERLAAKVENGAVNRWSFDTVSPFMMFDRVPWYQDSAWLMPAAIFAVVIVVLTALAWPVRALLRRSYGSRLGYDGGTLRAHRLTHGFAWLAVATMSGWLAFLGFGLSSLPLLAGPLDWLLWTVQILSPIAFFGLAGLAIWNVWLAFTVKRGWQAKVWSVLLLVAAAILLLVALAFNLIGFGTRY